MEDRAVVPEYHSGNPLVRWLFHQRLKMSLRYVMLMKPSSLMDIGCGQGDFLEMLLKNAEIEVKKIRGIDIEADVEELSARFPNCLFQKASILRTGFSDGEFEVAVCLDTLEHIKEVDRAIAEIRRIIDHNGYLITCQPTESWFYKLSRYLLKGTFSASSGPAAGRHYYKAKEIDQAVRKGGFDLVIPGWLPLPPPFDLFHINAYRRVP